MVAGIVTDNKCLGIHFLLQDAFYFEKKEYIIFKTSEH
jgi:hypothetical protein